MLTVAHTFSVLIYRPNRFVTDYKPDFGPLALLSALFNAVALFLTGLLLFLIAALPQLLILALPISYAVSQGLEKDAKRKWWFYLFAGALIGGVPWLVISLLISDRNLVQFVEQLAMRATGLGAYSGMALKFRLMHLAQNTDIENSIK